jgi:hypothetical protein
MSDIPLDLQRKIEQRWAARFARPVPPAAPKKQELEVQDNGLPHPPNPKEKPAGLKRRA